MKKTALMFAVIALLGVAMSGLVWAETTLTTTTTANSAAFGFRPSAANIQTFTANTTTISCTIDVSGNGTCDGGTYVRNTTMPGAFTSRPDVSGPAGTQAVSANPDFGCGDQVATASACDELAASLHDQVNNGPHNTAPQDTSTLCGAIGPCIEGTLVGDLHSLVSLVSDADGMPSGSIVFDRTAGRVSSFNQEINQSVAAIGLVFSEVDGTGTNTWTASTGRLSGGPPGFPSYIPTGGLPITATLSVTQTQLGGEGVGDDVIGPYTINFPGNGTFPVMGSFFTPGLGVADWAGSTATVDTDGFPN